jgi:hypothetical protein
MLNSEDFINLYCPIKLYLKIIKLWRNMETLIHNVKSVKPKYILIWAQQSRQKLKINMKRRNRTKNGES